MQDKIIIALDVDSLKEEERLLELLSPYVRIFKVGSELFASCGPKAVGLVQKYDREVFLDLKFHDIPNTVHSCAKVVARLGIFMFNVHSLGGIDMMKAALEGAEEESQRLGVSRPKVLGVTVLTSIVRQALKQVGIENTTEEQVLNLARLAKDSGLDGVVASPEEVTIVRKNLGEDFLIVTPGVRLDDAETDDQRRISTPKKALDRGADYIVIGRPVTRAKDPVKAIESIFNYEA